MNVTGMLRNCYYAHLNHILFHTLKISHFEIIFTSDLARTLKKARFLYLLIKPKNLIT